MNLRINRAFFTGSSNKKANVKQIINDDIFLFHARVCDRNTTLDSFRLLQLINEISVKFF